MAALHDRYGIVLSVQRGTTMRFEYHCTDHDAEAGDETHFRHVPAAADIGAVERARSVIWPQAYDLIFFDGWKHPHYTRPLTSESQLRIVAVMNFYTMYCPESTRPPEPSRHLFQQALMPLSYGMTDELRTSLLVIPLLGGRMSEPMYRLIADDLRRKIESGELPPGTQMKSEVELREEFGQGHDRMASRHTVRDAIKLLVSRGLVETRPGQGTFVVTKMVPFVTRINTDPESGSIEDMVYKLDVQQQWRTPEETIPRVEVQVSAGLVAEQLKLAEGTQVISRHQERRIDLTPWSTQTTFYPMEFVTKRGAIQLLMAENIKVGMVSYLETLGINQVGWRDAIAARPPTGNERAFFGLSDRNEFRMEAGRVPPPVE